MDDASSIVESLVQKHVSDFNRALETAVATGMANGCGVRVDVWSDLSWNIRPDWDVPAKNIHEYRHEFPRPRNTRRSHTRLS